MVLYAVLLCLRSKHIQSLSKYVSCHRGGGGVTLQSLIQGDSAPRSNLLPFYIPFGQKRYPFYIPFIEKRYPFHLPTLENCTPFLSPYNEVDEQYYGKISSIIRRNAKQTTSVIYSASRCETTDFPSLLYT